MSYAAVVTINGDLTKGGVTRFFACDLMRIEPIFEDDHGGL